MDNRVRVLVVYTSVLNFYISVPGDTFRHKNQMEHKGIFNHLICIITETQGTFIEEHEPGFNFRKEVANNLYS